MVGIAIWIAIEIAAWGGIAIEIAGWGTDEGTDGGGGTEASSCRQPAPAWLATLQSAFDKQYRDAEMTALGYVEEDTSEGKAYYVAVRVEGVDGVTVFGTSKPPLQSNLGLIFAANSAASQLSDLGVDISEDSSVRLRYTRWITQRCTASRR